MGGRSIPIFLANSSAASVLILVFSSKFARAARTSAGGLASSTCLGGGRSSNISSMHVTRENITYRCNHQSASMHDFSERRPQSIVTPVRIVCPCEAVEVRNFAWVNGKPIRLTVCGSELLQVNSVSIGVKSIRRLARWTWSVQIAGCGKSWSWTCGKSSSQIGDFSKSSNSNQMPAGK